MKCLYRKLLGTCTVFAKTWEITESISLLGGEKGGEKHKNDVKVKMKSIKVYMQISDFLIYFFPYFFAGDKGT